MAAAAARFVGDERIDRAAAELPPRCRADATRACADDPGPADPPRPD
jgi:hypothetical protein